MRGYGPVRISGIGGFAIGLIISLQGTPADLSLIQILGILSLGVGVIGLFGRTPIRGPLGGLFIGFGLGASLGTLIWPYLFPTV